MKLPNIEQADVPEAKITRYLLDPTHPDGRGKALFFLGYGFHASDWETLAMALRQHARDNDVIKMEDTPFGRRYVVEGILYAADTRTPRVRVVWFIENDETIPRFVTAYPLPSG